MPRNTGRETITRRDFPVFKSEWNYTRNEHLNVLYELESTSYPVIVILSSFSWGTNLFATEITKIASRYGFASCVSDLNPRPSGLRALRPRRKIYPSTVNNCCICAVTWPAWTRSFCSESGGVVVSGDKTLGTKLCMFMHLKLRLHTTINRADFVS